MKKDKLKSLLMNITGELKKLSKEDLLREAASSKSFSCIMWEANLLSSSCVFYGDNTKIRFESEVLNSYSVSNRIIFKADNYDSIVEDNYTALAA